MEHKYSASITNGMPLSSITLALRCMRLVFQ